MAAGEERAKSRSAWVRVRGWLPLVGLLAVLGLFLGDAFGRLEAQPVPPRSGHNLWELVPRMVHVLQGYSETEGTVERGNWAYACPERHPIPWSQPTALGGELLHGRLRPLLGHSTSTFWVEMPHSMALAAAAALLFPGRVEVPALVMLGYLVLLIVSVYGIGREARGPWTGLLAAALCAQVPVFGRYALAVEGYLPVTALSAAMIWSLLRSRGFTRPLPLLAYLALALTCMRSGEGFSEAVGAGMAVAFPFIFELIAGVVEQRRAGRSVLRPLLAAACVLGGFLLLVDRTWVFTGFDHILLGFEEDFVGGKPVDPDASPFAQWASQYLACGYLSWTTYLGPIAGMGLLLGLPWMVVGEARRRWSLLAWLAALLFAYNLMTRKAEWYALPLIPPLAVVAAVGLTAPRWRWLRAGTAGVGAILAVAALCARGMIPTPWSPALHELERRLSPDFLEIRAIGNWEESRGAAYEDYRRFVAWSWDALPPDGTLHHVAVVGQAETSLVHYSVTLLRQDLETVVLWSQQLAPCLGPDDVELLLCVDPAGALVSLNTPRLPYDRRDLEPWRGRIEHPEGAPEGVYRVWPEEGDAVSEEDSGG